MKAPSGDRERWLDRPASVRTVIRALITACVLLVLADLVYHKHVHYGFEGWFGFYGLYGFVACVFLVRAAVVMRKLLMRDEAYYEPVDGDHGADGHEDGDG